MNALEQAGSQPVEPGGESPANPGGARGLNSLPQLRLDGGRERILAYFENTWALTEMLFSGLASEAAFYQQPYHKTRHPLIFYYAHPVCFYVNKLLVSGLIDEPVNQEFELMFEVGVDEMNWDDLHNGGDDPWPELTEVQAYRRQVYELVRNLIQTHPIFDEPVAMDKPSWALVMAFEHERIHLETSSVLMRELPIDLVREPSNWPAMLEVKPQSNYSPGPDKDFPANPLIDIDRTTVRPGKPRNWPSFGWDNEYGGEAREAARFKASRFLISNGEFHEFVAAGGYEDKRYWSEQGWGWRTFRNVKWPTFWVQDGPAGSHRYKLRTTFREIPMQWRWPAAVNYYEAKAYCAWRSARDNSKRPYRLLSEAEYLATRSGALAAAAGWRQGRDNLLNLDSVLNPQSSTEFNHNLHYGSESPVDALPANEKGLYDTLGNVWQWCEDPFHPLTGFKIHPYYTDFSTPCFDGEHQMIMGGSFISTGDEACIWARFHFRPHFFQHAGFRLVQEIETPGGNKYESDELVNQYLLLHWGSMSQQTDEAIAKTAPFPQMTRLLDRTVELMNEFTGGHGRALDLGCAVGRASFDLTRWFAEVVGIDYSEGFIAAANALKQTGRLPYKRRETGRHYSDLAAGLARNHDPARVSFLKGDAANLGAMTGLMGQPFDAVLLCNLLCRLANPAACLGQFAGNNNYLGTGGVLVIASPNTWMEQYTRQGNFLDGADSEATLAAIGDVLNGFSLLHHEDVPFMIREHRRKYEYIISQVSVWKKNYCPSCSGGSSQALMS